MDLIPELYSVICETYQSMNRTFDIPVESITSDTELKSLGIDSLSFVVILMNIESKLNVTLPVDGTNTINTVGDVIKMIEASK